MVAFLDDFLPSCFDPRPSLLLLANPSSSLEDPVERPEPWSQEGALLPLS